MIKKFLAAIYIMLTLILSGCDDDKKTEILVFATCADYPPFEFYQNNELKGFDVELAQMIAQELKKEAKFEDMQFDASLVALQNGSADAAISTITITEDRKKNFDFSDSYHEESLAIVSKETAPLKSKNQLSKKKIACQLGTTMEIWLKDHAPDTEIVLINHNNQAIEALKAGHVDGVLIDKAQAIAFTSKNPGLVYSIIAKADNGYGIAFKKGSKLKDEINKALALLQQNGKVKALEAKYLESTEWNK